MSCPKATSQSFLPASRCTGGEHAACSCPPNVGVVCCYWNVLWLSRGLWCFLHHLLARQSARGGSLHCQDGCTVSTSSMPWASCPFFSVMLVAVPELRPLPKGLITQASQVQRGRLS